jgi:diguanylate cyclase (GGDEF)-like protein
VRLIRSQAPSTVRLATVGLGLVLLLLGGFAVWGVTVTHRASEEVLRSSQLNDVYQQARLALAAEQELEREYLHKALEHRYITQATSEVRDDFERKARALDQALQQASRYERNREDARTRNLIRVGHDRYRNAVRFSFTLAASDPDEASQVHRQLASTSFQQVTQLVIDAAARERQRTAASVKSQHQLGTTLMVATPFTFAVGLGLLGVFLRIASGYRRRVERQAAENQHQALHDALTGLPNRVLLFDRAEQAVRAAHRHGEAVGLLLLDLDRFKEVNDTLGHHNGDLLLKQVAARLSDAVREVDTAARLGGDEFAVVLPRVGSAHEATRVAERLLDALRQPVDLEGLVLDVSASIGVAVCPDHGHDAGQLLQYADIAMYAAKRSNLGVAVYDPNLDEHSPRRLTLLSELRRAIDQGELVLHYQPKAEIASGRVAGVEALVRWQHPTHGLLGPSEFIPLAEQTEMIEPLTRHVMAEALAQCRRWQGHGLEVPVSVNVPARCLLDPGFPAEVAGVLAAQQVPARLLTLEIHEQAVMADPPRALEALSELRSLGVQLAMDDFGAGCSSMAYLQDLPLHELKIDRTFVTHMQAEASSKAIVRAVLELARNLDLHTVAEGVEDWDTWAALGALGCHTSQGFCLSKPLPADDLVAWLTRQSATAAASPAPQPAPLGGRNPD